MKRTVCAFLALLLMLSISVPVHAASGTVELCLQYPDSPYYEDAEHPVCVTVSGVDTEQEPDSFSISYTDYDQATGTEVQNVRKAPIYPADGTVVVTLSRPTSCFDVTKMVKLESGSWSFDGELLPVVGKASYNTHEPAPEELINQNNGGYDDSALTGYTTEHIIDASEMTEDLIWEHGAAYMEGCTVTISEPGLYYIYTSSAPAVGFSEGFVRVEEASAASDTPQQAPSGYYPSSWARSEVNAARATGLVPDYWGGDYDCLRNVTRDSFCALAAKLYCLCSDMPLMLWAAEPPEPTFSDAPYQTEIELMYWLKVVDGVGDGNFNPSGELTREQAAKILTLLYNAVEPGIYDAGHDYWTGQTVADFASVSPWAKNYVGFVMEKGIMTGVGDDKFDPQGKYTVQQALLTMYRLAGRTKLWTAPADGALTVYDLGISRRVYDGLVEYKALSDAGVADISCIGIKVAGTPVTFSGSYGEYFERTLDLYCEVATYSLTRYEFSLTVTMEDGTVYELVDAFQHISSDLAGGVG